MGISLSNFDRKAKQSVMAFWGNREKARQKQIELGVADLGERAGVTGGKNMDGFVSLIKDLTEMNGLGHASIHLKRALLTLPGYFRPTKLWDILVILDDILCQKLVREKLYTSASVIASKRSAIKTGKYDNLSEMTSLKSFVAAYAGHIASVRSLL